MPGPLAALLAQGLALGFSASASPGPFQALLLQQAARLGPRRALHLALVPAVSDPPVIVACLFALAGLPAGLLRLLALAGGTLRGGAAEPVAFLASFYLSLIVTNAFTVLAFGAVGRLGPRAARVLGGLSAVAFLLLGLAQLWRGLA